MVPFFAVLVPYTVRLLLANSQQLAEAPAAEEAKPAEEAAAPAEGPAQPVANSQFPCLVDFPQRGYRIKPTSNKKK